jgi:hypothetical protein
MNLKKLLRSSIMKGVAYIQAMLDILDTIDSVSIEDAKYKLSLERERHLRKNPETSVRQSMTSADISSVRSLTPRTGLLNRPNSRLMSSFATSAN